MIADNYFGYCKKEVKTQISYSANLYGLAEEEHAGGAIAFASYDLGVRFAQEERLLPQNGLKFADIVKAAEKCTAGCLHPGTPWNPSEPGLDKLVARAAKYN